MAIGANYITTAQLKNWMGITISDYDALIDDVVADVSREVEDYCHRQFNDAGSATARVYYPNATDLCIVDDFSTTAGFILQTDDDNDGVFETTWTSSDYQLEPLNGVRNGRPGWPYWRIRALGPNLSFHGLQRASVKVTAQWGWAAVPPEVVQAAKQLATDTFQMKDVRHGIAGADQFGTVMRVRDNGQVAMKLRHFCRQKVFVQ